MWWDFLWDDTNWEEVIFIVGLHKLGGGIFLLCDATNQERAILAKPGALKMKGVA